MSHTTTSHHSGLLPVDIGMPGQTRMLIPITSPCFLAPETVSAPPDWSTVFGNERPLVLEIGCGTGHFVSEMAAVHPEWNFIAIDYYNKGCLKTCKRLDKAGRGNVRVARVEAREFITTCIAPESLRAVFVNCPDPWPKLRHRKRRLVQAGFMEFLRGFMLQGCDFYFATDFDDYGEDVARFMPEVSGFENVLAPAPWLHQLEGYPLSKYMLKFMGAGKRIYFIHYRRV